MEKKIKLIRENKQKKPARKNRKQKVLKPPRGKKEKDKEKEPEKITVKNLLDTDVFKGFEYSSTASSKKTDFSQAVSKFAKKITKTLPQLNLTK